MAVPRQWGTKTDNTDVLATASFSPPGSHRPVLTIAVIRPDQIPETASETRELLDEYQARVRPDAPRYIEQDREAMSDGSWRMTGIREIAGGTESINTFIEVGSELVGIIDVMVPEDPETAGVVQQSINTFSLGRGLQPTPLDTLSLATFGKLAALNVHTWQTDDGVFFITGEIANYREVTASEIPVVAVLRTADGRGVMEATDFVMGHGVMPGRFAPFSLRFGD
ncbi:MAG: hypothetical protein AAF125_22080, partial [Chloroflexota bacterium]